MDGPLDARRRVALSDADVLDVRAENHVELRLLCARGYDPSGNYAEENNMEYGIFLLSWIYLLGEELRVREREIGR